MKALSAFLIPAIVLLGIWGYAYEVSYFLALGLNVHDYFGLRHFVAAGLLVLLPMLIGLVVLTQLSKFFTKRVHDDDAKTLKETMESTTFAKEIIGARIAAAISLIYWLAVILAPKAGLNWPLWPVFAYMCFVNLSLFIGSIYLSPPFSKPSIWFAFTASMALCISAGGYGIGLEKLTKDDTLRDDSLVRITRTAHGLQVDVKQVRIPLLFLQKALDSLASE